MRQRGLFSFLALLAVAALLSGCSGSTQTAASSGGGNMVIMGTDSPTLSNVVSFVVPISGITLSGNGQSNVSVLSAPASIDFSQLVGLRTLLSVQPTQAGNYTSATITFGANPTLSILDTTVSPPQVKSLPAAFSSMSVTINFPNGETEDISQSKTLGMVLDFHLDKSIPVDSSGNIVETGGSVVVTPVITVRFLDPDRDRFGIDELRGGVVSVGSNGTFVIETGNRFQFTIATDSNTKFEPSGQSFATLSTNDIVEVEDGQVDPATMEVKASDIEVIPDKFVVNGLVTAATPPASSASTTCATNVSLLVRDALPAGASGSFPVDQISQISLTGAETYAFVHQDDNILSGFSGLVFNSCSIVPGQALMIGGSVSGSTLTAAHVLLGKQGFSGTAATSIANAMFTFNAQGLAGTLLPSPVTVEVLQSGDFDTDLQNVSGGISASMRLRVAGLVLFNTVTNTTNILALRVSQPDQE